MSSAMRRIPENGILSLTVATSQSATEGYGAVFHTDDTHCDDAGANDGLTIGVFMDTATAGNKARVQIAGVAAVKLDGNATRGTLAACSATGFQNIPTPNAAGGTTTYILGRFMQSGVSGDMVGLNLDDGGGTVITA